LMGALSTLHVYVRRHVIEEAAGDLYEGHPRQVNIPPQSLALDPAMVSLMDASRFALDEGSHGSSIDVVYLARAIPAKLVSRYRSSRQATATPSLGPIGVVVPVVAEAIDYMRAHIDEPISLEDIARAVNRSASHLARQFRTSLGVPPHQYLLVMRIKL